MSYIKLSDAKNAIMNCIGAETVSKYATSAECRAARHGADLAIFALDTCPTADVVEVGHGEWVFGKLGGRDAWVCSLCGAGFTGKNAEWIAKEHDFCPKCGAKMGEERKDKNEG